MYRLFAYLCRLVCLVNAQLIKCTHLTPWVKHILQYFVKFDFFGIKGAYKTCIVILYYIIITIVSTIRLDQKCHWVGWQSVFLGDFVGTPSCTCWCM